MLWYVAGIIFFILIFLTIALYVLYEDMIETKHNYQKNLLELELIKHYDITPEYFKKIDKEL